MKRKTSSLPTRIWTYGCRAPTVGGEIVQEQLWKAHRYYNKLIEIDLERRRLYREARRAIDPTIAALEDRQEEFSLAIDAQRAEIQLLRQSKRQRVADPVAVETLSALKTQRKATTALLREARGNCKALPALVASAERIAEMTNEKVRNARGASGVYWGTYLLVEKAVEAAQKACKRKGTDPSFKRWSGGQGRIGVQLHREPLADVLQGRGTMIQVLPHGTPKGSCWSKSGLHGIVRVRVGSDAKRQPVWAEFPVLLHQLPPADAILTWAWVSVRKVGPNFTYELQLSLESETFHLRRSGRGAVALDIGWRQLPNGDIRVGYVVDDQGKGRQIVLPAVVRNSLDYANKLRGYSDQHFDAARQVFTGWLATATGPAADWWREETRYMHQWRAHQKLVRVVTNGLRALSIGPEQTARLWKSWAIERDEAHADRFDTHSVISAWLLKQGITDPAHQMLFYLEWWRRKDHHLYEWECNQRDKALRRRKDIYRNVAADMAATYETLVLEKFDLQDFARNPKPEEEATDFTHRIRTIVSPHEFRDAILGAWLKSNTVPLPAMDTTRECHRCHQVNTTWAFPEELMQTCSGCAATWDQDDNAARVLLHRWREGSGDGDPLGGARGSMPAAKFGGSVASPAAPGGE